jgi:hypothetical protein
MDFFSSDEPILDINKMFELHYELTEIFENIHINIFNAELPIENDNGFIEYKRNLSSYKNKIQKLKTQIYWRISEGLTYNSSNSCYYIIGIEDDGNIIKEITDDEIIDSLLIIKKCVNESNIKYIHKTIIYKNKSLLVVKFWKEDILKNTDIRIILLGASESNKTKFFIGLHNCKFNVADDTQTIKKLFKSDIFDIHSDESKLKKTLILHHIHLNINFNKNINLIELNNLKDIEHNLKITEDEGLNVHIIDTPGNSIISNIKYLIGYNIDIIIHFNQTNNLYSNILEVINQKYNNVLKITDTTYLNDLNSKKVLCNALLKYNLRHKILDNIENILLINENRLMKSYQDTEFNKYIFYCYNLMNMNIFDKISDVCIRNIQYKYNYKSSIESNNSISIEVDKPIHKTILGKTNILETLEISDFELEIDDVINTYYVIILNQIYLINSKNIPSKIIFDKIILVPEKFKSIPIFIIWCKNNEYFIKIFNYINKNLLS